MKQRIEPPVFTWFLVGALLFSALTFLLGIWVCSNAPRAGLAGGDDVPTVVEQKDNPVMNPVPQGNVPPVENRVESSPQEPSVSANTGGKPVQVSSKQAPKVSPVPAVKKKTKSHTPKSAKKAVKKKAVIVHSSRKGKIYYVQLTATVNRKLAEKMKRTYAGKGYNMYLITVKQRGKILYKVRIGVFKDWSKAKAIAEKIRREDKLKPWIIAM